MLDYFPMTQVIENDSEVKTAFWLRELKKSQHDIP